MTRGVEVKEGQSFQDRTGLTVRVERIDANNRIHFSVIVESNCLPVQTRDTEK
jgi:hypothetical protein